ncbi:Type I inositol 1,4,5-trisphosphate 5-phosphatase 1 [Apostasia shenzhenica]|uniref:Type I inositol 1,4,5-trisphosphate 5-phosphatase 1 n=1 Tax=Apostasia shenzhenica TaxID=1088818 RepID=A0A2I0B028_9ASPA|nr:Type I inositol 1,4,5-trisphosphate 5-phosphatase 1 [Apostasia shenzhenica]
MRPRSRKQKELWPKVVLRKWLNISSKDSEFSADDGETTESDFEYDDMCQWERRLQDEKMKFDRFGDESRGSQMDLPYKVRRRKSETLRAQYINTKELRICVGSWNVGGKLPPDDLDIKEWLDMEEPADIYVLGMQEVVPLNPGNIFGAEDNRPVPRWEYLIRQTLNKVQPAKEKYRCYSDPPSPSRFQPSDDSLVIEDALSQASDSETDDEIHPLDESPVAIEDKFVNTISSCTTNDMDEAQCLVHHSQSSLRSSDRLHSSTYKNSPITSEVSTIEQNNLTQTFSSSDRIGLIWPEQPLDLLAQLSLGSSKAFKSVKSFKSHNSFKSINQDCKDFVASSLIPELKLDNIIRKKKRHGFVRIISKQMVGIYLSIWVRRSLRRHIQNLKVCSVGVGVMGYIGNKGSISVSMSIYQTLFCFICCHLTSGEREGDKHRRNADVHEIHKRTLFRSSSSGLPKTIYDHERIIWLGDLNYRINLSFERTFELISKREWFKLAENEQLNVELKKGRAFDGWSEGIINFPPTYKYEVNSDRYTGDDPKVGRRIPAWCDRVLSFGKGTRLLDYRRTELKLSDHRPVTAIFMVDVEILCQRKLQRALTFTDAEIEEGDIVSDEDVDDGMSFQRP